MTLLLVSGGCGSAPSADPAGAAARPGHEPAVERSPAPSAAIATVPDVTTAARPFVYATDPAEAPDGLMRACAELLRDPAAADWQTYFPSAADVGRRAAALQSAGPPDPAATETVEHPEAQRAVQLRAFQTRFQLWRAVLQAEKLDLGGCTVRSLVDGEPWLRPTPDGPAVTPPPAPPSAPTGPTPDPQQLRAERADLELRQGTRYFLLSDLCTAYPTVPAARGVPHVGEIECLDQPDLRGWVEYASPEAATLAVQPTIDPARLSNEQLDQLARAAKAVSVVRCVFVFRRDARMHLKNRGETACVVAVEFRASGPAPSPTALLHWFEMVNPWTDPDFSVEDAEPGRTLTIPPGSPRFRAVEALCKIRRTPAEAPADTPERTDQCRRFSHLVVQSVEVRRWETAPAAAPAAGR